MSILARCIKNIPTHFRVLSSKYDASIPSGLGSGAGKGEDGGLIRVAGAPFDNIEVAKEEEYFHKLQQGLLLALKITLGEENSLRNKAIDKLKCAIEENNKLTNEIARKLNECDKRLRIGQQRDDPTSSLEFIYDD